MPRPPRLEYPNAFYHVMNRGRNRETIFHDEWDFKLFLDIIAESVDKFNIVVHCYCLMDNHYHLLLETPDANLRKAMQFIGWRYVTSYNKKYNSIGPLFQSRYKAILVDKDNYLLELSRYIHLNPIEAGSSLGDYKWSSYPAYIGLESTPDWLCKNVVFSMHGGEKYVNEYMRFVEIDGALRRSGAVLLAPSGDLVPR